MTSKNKVAPRWVLIGVFIGLVVGFIIGILSAPGNTWTFNVLPITIWSGPIVIAMALLYVYMVQWRKKEKEE
ncbi:MAG: hypothetical protein GF329_06065 [Candidatus Lokiarchaeota archaeon]|nr:hypothetical protein [Candidatus Lokiarchaeota archaeon]